MFRLDEEVLDGPRLGTNLWGLSIVLLLSKAVLADSNPFTPPREFGVGIVDGGLSRTGESVR